MKGTKKACVIGCLLAVFLGLGAMGTCMWTFFTLTAPVMEASERFLTLISQGKVAEAYEESASTLRASSSEEEFASSVRELGFADSR